MLYKKHRCPCRAWRKGLGTTLAFFLLVVARLTSAVFNIVHDCDEVYNYWEPLHYLLYGYGMQTWEYRCLPPELGFLIALLQGKGWSTDSMCLQLGVLAQKLLVLAASRSCGSTQCSTGRAWSR